MEQSHWVDNKRNLQDWTNYFIDNRLYHLESMRPSHNSGGCTHVGGYACSQRDIWKIVHRKTPALTKDQRDKAIFDMRYQLLTEQIDTLQNHRLKDLNAEQNRFKASMTVYRTEGLIGVGISALAFLAAAEGIYNNSGNRVIARQKETTQSLRSELHAAAPATCTAELQKEAKASFDRVLNDAANGTKTSFTFDPQAYNTAHQTCVTVKQDFAAQAEAPNVQDFSLAGVCALAFCAFGYMTVQTFRNISQLSPRLVNIEIGINLGKKILAGKRKSLANLVI